MGQTLVQTMPFRRKVPVASTGRFLKSAGVYFAAAGAATRTSVAVAGRRCPSEDDLRTLGIERTPAYRAVTAD